MENKKNITIYTIVLVLLLAFSVTVASIPATVAHTPPWTVKTWSYISLACPNPIGVNQEAVIIFWPNAVPPTAQGQYGDRWTWNIEVTKPDGSKQNVGPITSDPIGGGYILYKPDQTGKYTFVAKMDQHVITGLPMNPALPPAQQQGAAYVNDTYLASQSDPVTLTVQQEAVEGWTETPQPNYYWTRPINNANREWWPLAGNWLAGAAQINGPTTNFGYGKAPESAHILWSRPMWAGGIMDARFGNTGFQTYHYEGLRFEPPIVMYGKLYYNVHSLPKQGWYCVDLYTGETTYFQNTTGPVTNVGGGFDYSGRISGGALSFGQIFNYDSPNQHGGMPYLWCAGVSDPFAPASTAPWMMLDAFTGNYICSIGNVTQIERRGTRSITTGATGTAVYGKDGSILRYNIVNLSNTTEPELFLQVWNTTQAIWYEPVFSGNSYWMWRPTLNMTFDGRNGFSLNVSIPDVGATNIRAVREGQFIIGGSPGRNNEDGIIEGYLWCLSLEPGKEGTLLWNRTFVPPSSAGNITMTMGAVDPEDGVFLFQSTVLRQRWGYSLETGQLLWGPTEPEPALNYYGMTSNIWNGKLLTAGYGGVLMCYDIKTGEVLWNYTAAQQGWESPYGNYPIGIGLIADGKVYIGSGEHSPTQPLWRGSNIHCIDIETGQLLWKCMQLGVSMPSGNAGDNFAISDGHLVALNAYDNKIYCWARGPSATTVSAPETVIPLGTPVLIKGTVTDQSPGAKDTPAISDEDMEAWMNYLYQQQPIPGDAKGVPIKLTAVDPKGTSVDIGTVTSDMSGQFSAMWTPTLEGIYTVVATFEGSKSYYPSYAQTTFGVGPASASVVTTPTPTSATPTPLSPTSAASETPDQTISPSPSTSQPGTEENTTIYITIAAVVIIAAVAATALILKRRAK